MLMVRLSHSGSGIGRVAVDDHGRAAIVGGPVVADGQAELVDFAGGFAEERKVPHLARTAALHFFFHASVSDDQAAVVEDVVTDEGVEELGDLLAKFGSLFVELFEGFDDAVSQLDIFAAQFAEELDVVVAGNSKGVTSGDHLHHEAKHGGSVGATIDEVAEKDGFAAAGRNKDGKFGGGFTDLRL